MKEKYKLVLGANRTHVPVHKLTKEMIVEAKPGDRNLSQWIDDLLMAGLSAMNDSGAKRG